MTKYLVGLKSSISYLAWLSILIVIERQQKANASFYPKIVWHAASFCGISGTILKKGILRSRDRESK